MLDSGDGCMGYGGWVVVLLGWCGWCCVMVLLRGVGGRWFQCCGGLGGEWWRVVLGDAGRQWYSGVVRLGLVARW